MASFPSPLVDIGANLLDPCFNGVYHGTKRHESDFMSVLSRAKAQQVSKVFVTAGTLQESMDALALTKSISSSAENSFFPTLYSTVGVHPTRCNEFKDIKSHVAALLDVINSSDNSVVAVGECGLDYDRLHFCDKEQQMVGFLAQLELSAKTKLPLFLHNRNCGNDLLDVLKNNRDKVSGGGRGRRAIYPHTYPSPKHNTTLRYTV